MRRLALLVLVLLVSACGKNDLYGPYGAQPPYSQAPGYPGGPYAGPYGGMPGTPGYGYPGNPGYGSGYPGNPGYGGGYPGAGFPPPPGQGYPDSSWFNPQMPGGYPSAYTPFLPVDYYMRNHPQLAPYWPGFWDQWNNYSYQNGYSPYDFGRFWYEYCPMHWNQGGFYDAYIYLNQNFYYWASPQVQFSSRLRPSHFWANYTGFSYGSSWDLQFYF